MKIIYTGSCLTLSDKENVKIINSEHADFHTLIGYYKEEAFNKLEAYLNGFKNTIEEVYKKFGIRVMENIVFIDDEALPNSLGQKVLSLAKQNLPIERFVKFWNKLRENPSYTAVQSIFAFLERNNLPIMEDGNLIGYKAVRADWTDKHSGTYDNSIGNTLKIIRHLVDDNPKIDCSYGFHVGSQSYVKGFQSGSDHIVEVVVNPKDVVSVPSESRENKIRVCEYFVKAELNLEDFKVLEPPVYYDDDDDIYLNNKEKDDDDEDY